MASNTGQQCRRVDWRTGKTEEQGLKQTLSRSYGRELLWHIGLQDSRSRCRWSDLICIYLCRSSSNRSGILDKSCGCIRRFFLFRIHNLDIWLLHVTKCNFKVLNSVLMHTTFHYDLLTHIWNTYFIHIHKLLYYCLCNTYSSPF